MPNWVHNRITIDHPDAEKIIKENISKEKQADGSKEKFFDFNKTIPMPKELEGTSSPNRKPKLKDFDCEEDYEDAVSEWTKKTQELKSKYGVDNWYDWQKKYWGVKWGACNLSYPDAGNEVRFDTPWANPKTFLVEFSKKYPGADIYVEYADEDLGNNCGSYELRNGVLEYTDYGDFEQACEVWGYDPEEIKKEREEDEVNYIN